MAQAKTVPTTVPVADYLVGIADPQRRADCEALCKLMRRVSGHEAVMWGPSIVGFGQYHYRYASGREGDSFWIGFSSRKSDLTLYVSSGFDQAAEHLAALGPHKTSVSCLYVKRLADLQPKALEDLLRHGVAEMKRRYPPDSAGGIQAYHAGMEAAEQAVCMRLAQQIGRHLPQAQAKIWHRHPVWFLDGNPIVGYSKLKSGIRLLFWSGQSFEAPGLTPEGRFKAAEARFTAPEQIDEALLARWLTQAQVVQWDYKNIVKRKGRLERLSLPSRPTP